jgi:eukaryotic-like serine/threonine-protein kinase
MQFMIGQIVLHYKILEELGRGGMGVVYLAEDTKLKRLVAIKFLPKQISANTEERKRFEIEAQAAASLNHPNIATIYAIEEPGDEMFIVMEYIEGIELKNKIKSGPIPISEAVNFAIQIAEGLEAAHKRGIIHRDIKPSNIMITNDDKIKIMDFDLAKTSGSSPLTKVGTTVGTIAYMSPEQARGEKTDHRTDIWSFGVVLYEMIAGDLPFNAVYDQAVIYSILNDKPEILRKIRPSVPAELEQIVTKAMQKDPGERYQNIVEMMMDLDGLKRLLEKPSNVKSTEVRSNRNIRKYTIVLVGFLAILLFIIFGISLFKPANEKITSIAVIPLDNFSHDPDQDYFADGMTETLIEDLSKISALKVISRTSVMQYKGTRKRIPEIGRELNVDAILEGSVEKVNNRVKITTQLISAATDKHLWANSYERNLSDVLDMQNEVARTVASEIQIAITPQEKTRLENANSVNPIAHDAYLKGRFFLNEGDEVSLGKSKEFFEEAISYDSTFAPAYAGLADYYIALTEFYKAPMETMTQAMAFAKKALKLDETLAEAHVTLGTVYHEFEWNWKGAEMELTRAIALNNSYAEGHHSYALLLSTQGNNDEALKEINEASSLDPFSEVIQLDAGWIRFMKRDFQDAINVLNRYLSVDSTNWGALWVLGLVYQKINRNKEAINVLKQSEQISQSPMILTSLGYAYASSGNTIEARKILNRILEIQKHKFVCPYETGLLFLELGDKEKALDWMEKGYKVHSMCMEWIKVDPRVDALRGEPRFLKLQALFEGSD